LRVTLDSLGVPAVIDEVQRAADPLVLAIKQRLDRSRRPGQCVLTGSTNFLTTPTMSECLAGRIDLITLWPLSVGELRGGDDRFVDVRSRGPRRWSTTAATRRHEPITWS
jgi:predicted AAA+ superfamily ATPase